MTLLHQAAQKAVEAHYKELGDAWIAFDGSPGTAKRVNFALGMLGFAIDALVAQMSALQQQTEPVAWLVTGGRAYNDRAYIAKDRAELEAVDRRDGSKAVPLYTAPALQHQEEPREPVAEALSPRERELLTEVKVRLGEINLCQEWRDHAFAVLGRLAASPSTTQQQEVGSGPALNEGVPDAEAAMAYALKRWSYRQGTKECIAFYRGACWCVLAAAPSTPEKAGGVSDGVGALGEGQG